MLSFINTPSTKLLLKQLLLPRICIKKVYEHMYETCSWEGKLQIYIRACIEVDRRLWQWRVRERCSFVKTFSFQYKTQFKLPLRRLYKWKTSGDRKEKKILWPIKHFETHLDLWKPTPVLTHHHTTIFYYNRATKPQKTRTKETRTKMGYN